jgi:hypothetical protein
MMRPPRRAETPAGSRKKTDEIFALHDDYTHDTHEVHEMSFAKLRQGSNVHTINLCGANQFVKLRGSSHPKPNAHNDAQPDPIPGEHAVSVF